MKRIYIYTLISLFCIVPTFGQTPTELQANLPNVAGWEISPEIEIFNRDNLYGRINGAAPLFFENNFQEMTSLVYTKGDDYITIQAYRHAAPEDAFGMYTSERSSDMTYYHEIGGEAQGDEYGLFFFSGSIYVKMMANNESESIGQAMQEIAKGFAAKIDANAGYPSIFNAFPKADLIPNTNSYISSNYIGHEFLKPVFISDYTFAGKKMQAFVLDAKTKENAKEILNTYFNFTKQKEDFVEGNLMIKDRYNGNIPAVWKGQYIIGAFNDSGNDFPNEIYEFLNSFEL